MAHCGGKRAVMCAIMGYTGQDIDQQTLEAAFARLKSRGPDRSCILPAGGGTLLFHRLSIMGLTEAGMQPFRRDGCTVVCNGELYGFRPIKAALEKRGWTFESDSDCELLIPLWREKGPEMFQELDAEFAIIL